MSAISAFAHLQMVRVLISAVGSIDVVAIEASEVEASEVEAEEGVSLMPAEIYCSVPCWTWLNSFLCSFSCLLLSLPFGHFLFSFFFLAFFCSLAIFLFSSHS